MQSNDDGDDDDDGVDEINKKLNEELSKIRRIVESNG